MVFTPLDSGIRRKKDAGVALSYQEKHPIDFNACTRSKLLCCSTTAVHWAKFTNGGCRGNVIPVTGSKPAE